MRSTESLSTRRIRPSARGALAVPPWGFPSRMGWQRYARGKFIGLARAARPCLLLLVGAILVGFSGVLTSWAKPQAPVHAFRLLPDLTSSNLNSTSAKPPVSPQAQVTVPELPRSSDPPPIVPAVVQTVETPTLLDPPSIPFMGTGGEGKVDPAFLEACYAIRIVQLGENTMRQWKLLGYPAFVVAALLSSPTARASDIDGPSGLQKVSAETPPSKDEILTEQLKKLTESISALSEVIKTLQTEIKSVQTAVYNSDLSVKKALGDISDVKSQIAKLEKDVDALRKTPPTTISAYPPSRPSARLRVVNTFNHEATMIVTVNDPERPKRFYRILPGREFVTEPLPVGGMTYEVLTDAGRVAPRNLLLAANDFWTITVHPELR